MADNCLSSYSDAGRAFGVHRTTVADLVRVLGIVPKYKKSNAKGLDPSDLRRLAKVLGSARRASSHAS